jgi:hypothetical protein
MPGPWLKQIRDTGKLTVFNKATAWAVPVGAAIKSFNKLSLGVTLVAENKEKSANIVLVLGMRGGQQYPHDDASYGTLTALTSPKFNSEMLHGYTATFTVEQSKEIVFAAVFLPGKIKKVTNGQKEMVVVHELIHAAGLYEWHDTEGIMYDIMNVTGGGLLEANLSAGGGVKPMPPIRVGAETKREMGNLWP